MISIINWSREQRKSIMSIFQQPICITSYHRRNECPSPTSRNICPQHGKLPYLYLHVAGDLQRLEYAVLMHVVVDCGMRWFVGISRTWTTQWKTHSAPLQYDLKIIQAKFPVNYEVVVVKVCPNLHLGEIRPNLP